MPLSRINNPFLQVSSAGSVSSPALSTSGDTNTGIFFPAADTIAFSEGGAEAMRIDSSGKVGIGTTTMTNKLNVLGAIQSTSTLVAIDASSVAISQEAGYSRIASFGTDSSTPGVLDLTVISTNGGIQKGARIDSLGRFTLTSQPFFYAIKNTAQTGYNASSSGDVVVIYDTATTNTGSHYNTSTGKFTAPVAGNYIFYASAYSAATTFNQSWLVVNGSRGAYGTDWMSPTASNMAHGFWLIKLAANDTVGYHPYNGSATSVTIATNAEHVHFRGYLLS